MIHISMKRRSQLIRSGVNQIRGPSSIQYAVYADPYPEEVRVPKNLIAGQVLEMLIAVQRGSITEAMDRAK